MLNPNKQNQLNTGIGAFGQPTAQTTSSLTNGILGNSISNNVGTGLTKAGSEGIFSSLNDGKGLYGNPGANRILDSALNTMAAFMTGGPFSASRAFANSFQGSASNTPTPNTATAPSATSMADTNLPKSV